MTAGAIKLPSIINIKKIDNFDCLMTNLNKLYLNISLRTKIPFLYVCFNTAGCMLELPAVICVITNNIAVTTAATYTTTRHNKLDRNTYRSG